MCLVVLCKKLCSLYSSEFVYNWIAWKQSIVYMHRKYKATPAFWNNDFFPLQTCLESCETQSIDLLICKIYFKEGAIPTPNSWVGLDGPEKLCLARCSQWCLEGKRTSVRHSLIDDSFKAWSFLLGRVDIFILVRIWRGHNMMIGKWEDISWESVSAWWKYHGLDVFSNISSLPRDQRDNWERQIYFIFG